MRVFETRCWRRILEPILEEITGDWRRFHKAELHNLYSSSNAILTNKSGKITSARLVVRLAEERNATEDLARKD
jgi:hypothetical protein